MPLKLPKAAAIPAAPMLPATMESIGNLNPKNRALKP